MLFRKIESTIIEYLKSDCREVLLIDGARQVGKTFIIREACKKLYSNYIEINLVEDYEGLRLFENVHTVEDFYLHVSMAAGSKMREKENTIIFLDEIQVYPHLLTLLKFLADDDRYRYIASGSLLGVTLGQTTSIPIGSIRRIRMFPLDFEEFLYANGFNEYAINILRDKFKKEEALDEGAHEHIMTLFRKYLLSGGMPDAVNAFVHDSNIARTRDVQLEIHDYYGVDAAKYDAEHKLLIRRIYDLIPSNMENRKKRVVARDIENKNWKVFNDYANEFEYLINAGIALDVTAISNPRFPLMQSETKNLLKLYFNDVGILTALLFRNNIRTILNDEKSINMGAVYETVVASELIAHGHRLFYYDNRKKGEVDFIIDDYDALSVVPIEVKSGKDYSIHSALNNLLSDDEHSIKKGIVLSNKRDISKKGNIIYMPIYYVMFL